MGYALAGSSAADEGVGPGSCMQSTTQAAFITCSARFNVCTADTAQLYHMHSEPHVLPMVPRVGQATGASYSTRSWHRTHAVCSSPPDWPFTLVPSQPDPNQSRNQCTKWVTVCRMHPRSPFFAVCSTHDTASNTKGQDRCQCVRGQVQQHTQPVGCIFTTSALQEII